MAGETTITVIGNLVSDPELRFTQSGATVCNFMPSNLPGNFLPVHEGVVTVAAPLQ
jgi:single-strand DNA-binding protein